MTAYRFRVKLEWDPTSLWRDIVVGEDRTLAEFQTVLNESMGLNQAHLWFFGADRDYWQSTVKYQRPEEYENLPER
ncbi:plasmid pRiA4b ORF-3 family protein [Natronobiforma cellulositropha]|uniref:plasmid pRiA4b ORF-3 family protein n=1 Tax=Natronobiforma cellulositropha TaxID=1679076 RepID=UPI0021D60FC1|nr:plasmid pRiA4b ORF-3 family protein [Natronobiforma cellulositropha]